MAPPVPDGYFPPGSMLRRVHGERMVGLHYGQRALLIGAADPRNYVGTALSTRRPEAPFTRLAHTAKAFETIYFGTRAEADAVLAWVDRLHARVRGALPEDAGPYPAGTPYSAHDPELMLWTLAVQADSGRALYEALVRPLAAEEREGLWRDYIRFGELFGLPRADVPPTWVAFEAWYQGRLRDGSLWLPPGARRAGRQSAFDIPVPAHLQPGMQLANLLVLGTTPEPIRELYGLRWTPAHAAAFATVTAGIRRTRPLVPRPVRRGRCTRFFDAVVGAERTRLRRGFTGYAIAP